jgi:uncharacterized membrane protein YfcA
MSGMFGIGGGIVIVPVLTILFGFDLPKATGTSLAALSCGAGIFAVIAYYRAGKLHIMPAALVASGLVVGSGIGSVLALYSLDPLTVKRLYGVFVLVMSWRFAEPRQVWAEYLQRKSPQPTYSNNGNPSPQADSTPTPRSVTWDFRVYLIIVGLVAGVLAGMFGIGGGIIIVPALILLLNFDQKEATGTSLAALLLPVGLPGVITYYNAGQLDIPTALAVAFGLLVGAFVGAKIALGLSAKTVKRLYGLLLFAVSLRFLFGS